VLLSISLAMTRPKSLRDNSSDSAEVPHTSNRGFGSHAGRSLSDSVVFVPIPDMPLRPNN